MSQRPWEGAAEQQLDLIIADLRRQILDLQRRALRVPVLEADPGRMAAANVWLFPDGRLRSRTPDGVVHEYQTLTTPGATTSATGLPAPIMMVSTVMEWPTTWARSYTSAGLPIRSTPRLFYGRDDTKTYGRASVQIGFDVAAIRAELAGASIRRVELALSNLDNRLPTGGDLHVGTHSNDTEPSTYTRVGGTDLVTVVYTPRETAWRTLPIEIGQAIQAATASGVTVQQPSDDLALSGEVAGYNDAGGDPPRLRIEYVKRTGGA